VVTEKTWVPTFDGIIINSNDSGMIPENSWSRYLEVNNFAIRSTVEILGSPGRCFRNEHVIMTQNSHLRRCLE
jgi:hypothetical protein